MKRNILCVLCSLISLASLAQTSELVSLRIETRFDFMQEYRSEEKYGEGSGFKGRYLNLRLDGNITDGLSYSFRQRLNKSISSSSLFDATDWLNLTYTLRNWSFSAGKQVVGIGGYEYDRAPIDLYFCSEYWNNIACYQMGSSVTYATDKGNDRFMFQFCESPFRRNALNVQMKDMFAYNLMWNGSHGPFSSIYSVNFIEYLPGRFINYIALGNKLTFGGLRIELDFMNRTVIGEKSSGLDLSLMGEVSWSPAEVFNIFARATYDLNDSDVTGDFCVLPGTSVFRAGAGVECFPLKNSRNLRLHLNCCYTDGRCPDTAVLRPCQTILDAGLTWYMNVLDIKRKK